MLAAPLTLIGLLAIPISPAIAPDAPVPGRATGEGDRSLGFCNGVYMSALGRRLTRLRASDGQLLDVPALDPVPSAGLLGMPACDGTNFLLPFMVFSGHLSFVRIRAADGAVVPTGGNPTVPLSSEPTVGRPAAAYGDGNFFVVWVDRRTGVEDLYGARVRASDGVILDGSAAQPGLVVSSAPGIQSQPSVAFAAGHFLVAFTDARSGSENIYTTRVRASDGAVIDSSGLPIATSSQIQRAPAAASAGNDVLVVWDEAQRSPVSEAGIYGRRVRITDGGLTPGTAADDGFAVLVRGARAGTPMSPALVSGTTNYLMVAQTGPLTLMGMRVGAALDLLDGTAAAGGRTIRDGVAFPAPNLVNAGAQSLVTWSGPEGVRINMADGAIVDPIPLALAGSATNAQASPRASCGNDSCLFAWIDQRAQLPGIYAVRVRKQGGQVMDVPAVRLAPRADSFDVSFDGTSFVYAWTDGARVQLNRLRESDAQLLGGDAASGGQLVWEGTSLTPSVGCLTGSCLVIWGRRLNPDQVDTLGRRWRSSDASFLDASPGLSIATGSLRGDHPLKAVGGAAGFLAATRRVINLQNGLSIDATLVPSQGASVTRYTDVLSSPSTFSPAAAPVFDGTYFVFAITRMDFSGSTVYGARLAEASGARPEGMGIPLTQGTSPRLVFDGENLLLAYVAPDATFKGKLLRPSDLSVVDGGPSGAGFQIDERAGLGAEAGAGSGRSLWATQGEPAGSPARVAYRLVGEWALVAPDGGSDAADAAPPEAGVPDAPPDAAAPDAAAPDAAAPDAAVPDAPVPDAAGPDADLLDGGAPDGAGPLVDAAPGDAMADRPRDALAADAPGERPRDAAGPGGGGDEGCGCTLGGAPAPGGSALLLGGVSLALAWLRRGQRRRRIRPPGQ